MTNSLLQRIRRRKVVQWLLAYFTGAWALIQVLDLLADQFGWPPVIGRSITLLLGVGAVAVAVIAWYHGERGRQRVSGMELAIFAAILLLAGGTLRIGGRVGSASSGPQPAADNPEIAYADPPPHRASVAVLPFADLSAGGDQRYFADGVSEEILNRLAQIPGLRVSARTSSFAFREGAATADSIGRVLGVAHILEGSVRKQGDRIRITAQLIDAANAFHLWSRTFERELKDVFRIQDEIARTIADTLRLELTAGDVHPARPSPSLAAHDLYLRGRELWYRRGPALNTALALARTAVESDPRYAPAWPLLGHTYALLPNWRGRRWAEIQDSARGAVQRAMVLDPALPQAYAAAAETQKTSGHWAAAEALLKEALRLSPDYAEAQQDLADIYRFTGRTREAMHHARLVLRARARQSLRTAPTPSSFGARCGATPASAFSRTYPR